MFTSFRDLLSVDMDGDKDNVLLPTGVLEDYLRSEESDSEARSESQHKSKGASRWHEFVQFLRTRSTRQLSTLYPLRALKLSIRNNSMRECLGMASNIHFGSVAHSGNLKNFNPSELQIATNSFSRENVIGKGGYAEVYKGSLQDGQLVAIKRLIRGTPDERIKDFLLEFGIMAHVDHPCITKLIGYGIEGGMYLVLEFSPNGSLTSLLHAPKKILRWDIRYKVALGAAKGLLYLHEGCHRRIIHRDIKAANILLTKDYEPQICDFGLAKWLPEKWTHHTITKFEGSFGYLAPEYLMHGIVDEKTDVFSFGVLLLELITGRRALDYSQRSLVIWAKPLLRKRKIRGLIDPSLGEEYDSFQLNLVVYAASLCIRPSAIQRPRMSQVVQLLSGDIRALDGLKNIEIHHPKMQERGTNLSEMCIFDRNQNKQIALDLS